MIAALDRAAGEALEQGRRAEPLRVYLQLSLDGDESRGGVDIGRPDSVDELCAVAAAADGLEFVGLMAIPRWTPIRRSLHAPRRRRSGVQKAYEQPLGLSAGMSSDLESAVKHGSTCVRVGTALMGQRPLTSP